MSSRPSHQSTSSSISPSISPNASTLRHRATALRSFAGTIDQLRVTHIDEHEALASSSSDNAGHWQVRRQMLDRNLHQLHRAADELRDLAHRMWQCADGLELAHGPARREGM